MGKQGWGGRGSALDAKLATRAIASYSLHTMKKLLLLFVLVVSLGHAGGLLGEFYHKPESLWGRRLSTHEFKHGTDHLYSDDKTENIYTVEADMDNRIQRVTMSRYYYDVPVHKQISPTPLGPWTLNEVKAFLTAVVGNVKWKGDLTGGVSEDGTLAYRIVIKLNANNRIESADISVGRVGFDLGRQLTF